MPAKIFCIGLPKTGTTSLHNAVRILGLRSIHWPRDETTVEELRKGQYRLSVMKNCDMISDIPVPAIFPQLDSAFPGAKFILTTRDRDSWLTSQAKAGFNAREAEAGSDREFYRAMLYGVTQFNEERFAWVYDEHHRLVERYFSGNRAADLFTMDISKGEASWEGLCAFLGFRVPDVPFPHSNVAGEDLSSAPRARSLGGIASKLLSRLV